MTKNEFRKFAMQHKVSCRYSGNTKTMYLTGELNAIQALNAHLEGTVLNFKLSY